MRTAGSMCIAAALWAGSARGAVYNLKVLSDEVCDLTDLKSFCEDATSRWETNDEKAAAIAHWFGRLGNQSGPLYEWMPVEPILQFNTAMQAQCAYWTGLYCAVAEGGMGWVGRHYEVGDHTVPEVEYDGKRHYLDNTYKNFATKCDGKTIISITDMDEVAGPCEKGPRCKYHWLLYHSPFALCEDRDGYKPDKDGHDTTLIRGWLTGPWLRRDSASRAYFAKVLDEEWVKKRWKELVTECCHSVYRVTLNLRENEHYTRHWKPLGDTSDYFYPTGRGKDPDTGIRDRGRGNGLWVWEPDLSSDASFESKSNVASGRSGIHPASAGKEAVAVFKVQSANVTTGSIVEADVFRKGEDDSVAIEASCTAGHSWFTVWKDAGTGRVQVKENISDRLKGTYAAKDLRPVLNYLVRVRMTARGSKTDARLEKLKLKTITVCNRQSLPRLGLGRNYITVDCDKSRQHETLTLRPLLKNDLYKKYAVETAGLATQGKQTSWSATLYAKDTSKDCHATFELEAPRPIFRVRMGGSIWVTSNNSVRYEYRTWSGSWSGWNQAGLFNWGTRDTYHKRRNQTKYVEKNIAGRNVTKVQFRFVFRSSSGSVHGAGANLLRMEVDYPAADAKFKPLEVTYNWTEYCEPVPANEDKGGVTRSHTERIESLPHTYYVNTGGDVAPRTNWVRVNLQGSSPEPVKPGYSDGKDVGDKHAIPSVRYVWGKLLSLKEPYAVSKPPAQDGFHAGGDEQELTDGRVKEPQVSGPWPDRCIAHWPSGVGTLEVTVDLGSEQLVGGARVDTFYRAPHDRFPNSVVVQTSTDGRHFAARGRDRHHAAKYALNGWPANWPLHPRYDATRWGEFPNYGLLGNYIFIPFEKQAKARYVKFLVEQQPNSGLMLSEVNVWDNLEAVPWTPRLAHEPPAGEPARKKAKSRRPSRAEPRAARKAGPAPPPPQELVDWYRQAMTFLALGRRAEAAEYFRKIAEKYPDTTRGRSARRYLERMR